MQYEYEQFPINRISPGFVEGRLIYQQSEK